MRFLLILLFVFGSVSIGFSQSIELAQNYYEQGEFEKAKTVYQNLYKKDDGNITYLTGYVESLQALEEYQEAEKVLLDFNRRNSIYPNLLVEIGHNYQLQDQQQEAEKYFQQAIDKIDKIPNYAYNVGNAFQKYNLLDEAVAAYEKALEKQANSNFIVQLANIYGEQGKLEKMFATYLDLIREKEQYFYAVNRNFATYVNEDPENEANQILRKLLLKRIQQDPDVLYNQMLSWLFIQQKEYNKAFIQEKAVYQRSANKSLRKLTELASIAAENNDFDTAESVLIYAVEQAPMESQKISAYEQLFEIKLDNLNESDQKDLAELFQQVFDSFGRNRNTLPIQLQYAQFLAFHKNEVQQARQLLSETLEQQLNRFEEARAKMVLADILVKEEQFNQALIFYSQIQRLVQNNELAQEATYKVAKTSYYKGDFKWAQTQLKVLKTATSQLIANDALQLNLLIEDNSLEDSTQTALKRFAKADLYIFQQKNEKALQVLDTLLVAHKGEKIEDEALLRKAKILEKQENFEAAKENYEQIIQFYGEDILADDAYYFLAELYNNQLNEPEKAKQNYEKIIFNFADSIFYVDARKKYRKLRGDEVE